MAEYRRYSWITVLVVHLALAVTSAWAQCAWWDGFDHPPAGKGLSGYAYSMLVWDDDGGGPHGPALYVGGSFTMAGSVVANGIAKWDGVNWSPLGGGFPGPSVVVYALAIHNDGSGPALYAGGEFSSASGAPGNSVAKWNGTSWSSLGSGITEFYPGSPGKIYSLASYQGSLYVGGYFYGAGDSYASHIAKWDGTSWSMLDDYGVGGEVYALAVFGSNLYVGGSFSRAGMDDASGIAKWNGTTWSTVGTGLTGYFHTGYALRVGNDGSGSALYVGGSFTTAGGVVSPCIAKWANGSWSAAGAGVSYPGGPYPEVYALGFYDDGTGPAVYVGGRFTKAGGISAIGLARWAGGSWSTLQGGVNGASENVKSLAVFDGDGAGPNPSQLYAGGEFTSAGGITSSGIARWFDRDSDGDGLLDCWETSGKGIDYNHDGTYDLDLHARGARANHKDVFVEVDAMIGMAPDPQAITDVVGAFDDVPNDLVSNPDGIKGVKLHVDLATMETTIPGASWIGLDASGWPLLFDTNKSAFFGTPAERANPNQLAAKRCAYRYCIFASSYGATTSSGLAEIEGNDFMVTLGLWSVSGGTTDQQAGTFMHELGHTLGLMHGGGQWDNTSDDRYNYKPNYHSVMSYTWQVPAMVLSNPPATPDEQAYVDSWRLDYSHSAMGSLNEASLNEVVGISGGNALLTVPTGPPPFHMVPEADYVDWNRNDFAGDTGVARDINRLWAGLASWPNDWLDGYSDWPNLVYNFRDSSQYADGVHDNLPLSEMTQAIVNLLASRPNGCSCDLNSDLEIDGDDLSIFLGCATGPVVAYDPDALPPGCSLVPDGEQKIPADVDRDGDVDQDDFGVLQRCRTGP